MRIHRLLYSAARRSAFARKAIVHSPFVAGTKSLKTPNLVIIGAQKSGTTSLHQYLGLHPEVFMPHFKEPGYFLDHTDEEVESTTRAKIRLGLRDEDLLKIMNLGYGGEPWFGDGSTYYTMAPLVGAEVPRNIHARSPDARLIYILRDPYDRIVSQFLWGVQNNFATGKLNEVLERRFEVISAISSYHRQLENYLKFFPLERISVFLFSELKAAPAELTNAMFETLGLEPIGDLDARIRALGAQNTSRKRSTYDRSELTIAPELQQRLVDVIEPDIDALERLTGRDLSAFRAAKAAA